MSFNKFLRLVGVGCAALSSVILAVQGNWAGAAWALIAFTYAVEAMGIKEQE